MKYELPDFDEMFALAENIGLLMKQKLYLEHTIELMQADTVKTVVKDEVYFVNGKPPSMEFIKTTYLKTGISLNAAGESIVSLQAKLNIVISDLEKTKLKFQIYKDMIDVWRTVSANERAAVAV